MSDTDSWHITTEDDLPPEGQLVDTLTDSGRVQPLRRRDGLWFLPDNSSYVYYTPTFWKEQR